jgi:hypothetical protein
MILIWYHLWTINNIDGFFFTYGSLYSWMMVFVDVLSGPNGWDLFFRISSSFLLLVINHPLARFESSSVPLCTHQAHEFFVVYFLSLSLWMIFIWSQLHMWFFSPHYENLYSCMLVSMDDNVTLVQTYESFLKLSFQVFLPHIINHHFLNIRTLQWTLSTCDTR